MAESCSRCGTLGNAPDDGVPDDGVPAGWSFAVEDGRVCWLCPDCARRNIRAIEGKLPEEWWE
jgi:rubredoxin